MANLTVEELKVLISAETAGLQKAVSKVQNQLQGLDKTTTKVTTKMSNAFSKLAKAAGITVTIASLFRLGKAAVNAASALEEVQNVVDVAFGEASAEIDRFAKTCIERFGLSEFSAKQLASQFMAMGSSMGIANGSAKTMSVQLTGLAADLASFYNVSVDTAMNALEGIYTGQTRALRKFGLVVDEATLQEYALSQGISKTVRTMTAAEQATLRYNYVLQQTVNAQNDFARTSGTWANQLRLLRQQWNSFMTELGSVITVILLPIVKWLNTILAYLTAIVKAFKAVFGLGGSVADKANKSVQNLDGSVGAVATGLGAANKAGKELKKTLAGFDELEILNGPTDDSGSGSGSDEPIGIGGGYDVGSYFDPEDWDVPDTSAFQKKMEEIFQSWKDGWDKLTEALTKNTETMEKVLDWKKILGIGALVGILAWLGTALAKAFDASAWVQAFKATKLGSFFATLHDMIAATFADAGITKSVSKLGAFIKKIFSPLGKLLHGWLIAPIELFIKVLKNPGKAIEKLGGIAKTVFGAIGKAISGAITWVSNLFWQCTSLEGIWQVLRGLGQTLAGVIKNLWGIIAAHPLASLTAALTLVITSFISLYNRSEEFRKAVTNLWNNVLKPLVDYVKNQAKIVWDTVLLPLWNNIKGLVSDLVALVTAIWNKVSEFIAWVTYYIIPPIAAVAAEIIACVTRIFGNVGEIINGIITAIRGIIQFLTGVFTGDWKKAWEGIKNVFKGIWDSLVGVVKGPINLIIGIINVAIAGIEGLVNSVINGLNRICISMPNWSILGSAAGKTLGFNLSNVKWGRIAYLAQGGVLDQPTAAMMGEYAGAHNNPEIVTPENLMRDIFAESNDELAVLLDRNNRLLEAILEKNVSISIGDDVISAAAARGDRDFRKRTGRSQFAV